MRILIEEYKYDVASVKDILHGIDALENVEGKVSIHYVGYYYNALLRDCVFILPKVLLMGEDGSELAFGKYKPEAIANLNLDHDHNNPLSKEERDFLYTFAVWIYRAIVVYKNDSRCDSEIVYHTKIAQVGKGSRRLSNTYLDILLQLIQFNRDNESFFFFIVKNLHSGFNKINWNRTISHSTAIVQNGQPVYLKPVNKKRQINFDEELLVIFFSILNYIGDTYGFPKEIKCQFPLIKGAEFKNYLNGYGRTRLRQIKYKYFSDKALELWNLCYAFFDQARQVLVNTDRKEYLLVKNFYTVFEAIIDELIGDNPLPDDMTKKQEDGKIIDHLFTAKSLIENEYSNTYFIGDSKYYKMGHKLGEESIYKQYTYARNVIQHNIDIFNNGETPKSGVRLRDDVTEGYNIIPNFFISAKMDKDLKYIDDGIEKTNRAENKHSKTHFKNRLFDRDTLLLFHYDVNFLFVLSLYARNNASQKALWKNDVREKFRKEIQVMLNKYFQFYIMTPLEHIDGTEILKQNFKEILGKVFKPYPDSEMGQQYYSLALEKPENIEDSTRKAELSSENAKILGLLGQHFEILECKLGEDKRNELQTPPPDGLILAKENELVLLITKEGTNFDLAINQIQKSKKVGIALKMDGAVLQLVEGFTKAKYLIIHNKSKWEAFGFDSIGPKLVPADNIDENMVVTKKDESLYLVYTIDTRFKFYFGELDISIATKGGDSYSPKLMPLSKLLKEQPNQDS